MSQLPSIIRDLALILILAGIITYIFKRIKQPVVLGYILAGFLVGPYFNFFPSIVDSANVEVWSEIGVIFLLFALGLEFSFKKLFSVGATAFITAGTLLISMFFIGMLVGRLLGWTEMDCIFLGAMLPMSSTTIIIKEFDDYGLNHQKFASIVFGTLVVEDLFAVLMMVVLSTVAVSKHVSGTELLTCIAKLVFFLVLCFVVGIYVVPTFFKHAHKWMNDETLLIISIGLCLGMVIIATSAGFSSALGAFIMGSLLSETVEGEHIDKLVSSIKNLFGAVFFVSVGMLVDPHIIVTYMWPIVILTLVVLIFQPLAATFGVIVSGQMMKPAIQVGFSFSQVGEFAFILASLGISLKVLSPQIYPIIVTVSIVTTLASSYMVKLSTPFYNWIYPKIPVKIRTFLDEFSLGTHTANTDRDWKKVRHDAFIRIIVYSVIIIAVILLLTNFLFSFVTKETGKFASFINLAVSLVIVIPLVKGLNGSSVDDRKILEQLWQNKDFNRGGIVAINILRTFLASAFITFVINMCFVTPVWLDLIMYLVIYVIITILPKHRGATIAKIEKKFMTNYNDRENQARKNAPLTYNIADKLSDRDIHMGNVDITIDSIYAGHTIAESQIRKKYGVNIVKIVRGRKQINLPSASEIILPTDKLYFIGTDEQISKLLDDASKAIDNEIYEISEILLKSFVVESTSNLVGLTLINSGIREKTGCMVVGIERNMIPYMNPDVKMIFEPGDLVWVVGDNKQIQALIDETNWGIDIDSDKK